MVIKWNIIYLLSLKIGLLSDVIFEGNLPLAVLIGPSCKI